MRIGSFIFPVSHHPHNDGAVIDTTLQEIELAERIGLDAVWLTEHHFDGAVAYADPLVFGAAVAARTKRVKIGFAVVELAMHHPIRLAVQTATLDNLSHGRLIVGTGRGSAFNHYEYIGFGIDMQDGIDRLDESEELLVKAWTETHAEARGRALAGEVPDAAPAPVPEAAPAAHSRLHQRSVHDSDGEDWQARDDWHPASRRPRQPPERLPRYDARSQASTSRRPKPR